jgi:hypothetical protein
MNADERGDCNGDGQKLAADYADERGSIGVADKSLSRRTDDVRNAKARG